MTDTPSHAISRFVLGGAAITIAIAVVYLLADQTTSVAGEKLSEQLEKAVAEGETINGNDFFMVLVLGVLGAFMAKLMYKTFLGGTGTKTLEDELTEIVATKKKRENPVSATDFELENNRLYLNQKLKNNPENYSFD